MSAPVDGFVTPCRGTERQRSATDRGTNAMCSRPDKHVVERWSWVLLRGPLTPPSLPTGQLARCLRQFPIRIEVLQCDLVHIRARIVQLSHCLW